MSNWEYLCLILYADVENEGAWHYLQDTWPNWDPPPYPAEALTPELNAYARDGWELLNLQPVSVMEDGKVAKATATNTYLCTFKRSTQEDAV